MQLRIEIGRDSNGYYYGWVYDDTPGNFCGQNVYSGPARMSEARAQRDAVRWISAQQKKVVTEDPHS